MDILLDYIYKLQDKFPQLKSHIQEYEANSNEESFIKLVDETITVIEGASDYDTNFLAYYPLLKALIAYKMRSISHKGGNK